MVYVHVPFCKSFCRYCDFYSELTCGRAEEYDAYIDEICAEARLRSGEIKESQELLKTLYIGGGTPSVMPLRFFFDLMKALPEGPYEEFTVEVNPDDIVGRGMGFIRNLREVGVNRVSMGVQSLDDGMLRWMGRRHDSAAAIEAFHMLREGGIENISLDIIFGINGLTDEMLSATLNGILALGPEHISAYQLSIEEGSQLAKDIENGKYEELPDEQCAAQYKLICDRLSEAGYRHYEISNWARAGREAVHNSAYWRRVPYVGLGPGAHSLDSVYDADAPGGLRETRSWNSESLTGWTRSFEVLSPEEIREEKIMLGLRTADGIDDALLPGWKKHSDKLARVDSSLRIPEDKWFVADSIIADLL
ncbi:MAG: radical SAM family heme chaperone HemW [Bacteroidales bacterium]|nr:radical SAM family heme chaperone HemW [Bacteroidales bacterium]